jgi:hypothetical protein
MAVYYYLAVACTNQKAAEAVSGHFDGLLLALEGGLSIHCRAESVQDCEGAWWSTVRPYGASVNAFDASGQPEPNLVTNDQRSEIGRLLYEHLRTAPDFRYALFAAEAMDSFFDVYSTHNILLRDPAIIKDGWEGLVIDQTLWEQSGHSEHYLPFRAGYVWKPYQR